METHLRAADNPLDTDLVDHLEKMIERTRLELATLSEPASPQ